MRQKNNFKIYTHHYTTLNARRRTPSFATNILQKCLTIFFTIGTGVYYVLKKIVLGLFIIVRGASKSIIVFFHAIKKDVLKTKHSWPLRIRLLVSKNAGQSFILIIFFSLLSWGLFASAGFVAKGLELKTKIFGTTKLGVKHLTQAEEALKAQNPNLANDEFAAALQNFKTSQTELADSGVLLNGVIKLIPQAHDSSQALDAASLISKSGRELITFYQNAETLTLTPNGIVSQNSFADTINTMNTSLYTALTDITKANDNIHSINAAHLPDNQNSTFEDLKIKLGIAQSSLQNLAEVFTLFRHITASPKNMLLIFENNNELRAGGGFIGTYGNFVLTNGAISKLTVNSIYDLDGQLQQKIIPPRPVQNVNTTWFMRDSNWFASFPDSAKKINEFYEKEGGETADMLIAITPTAITNLLAVTGPIPMPAYNVTLNSDNFVELTQGISTISITSPENKPKQILADFMPILLQKIAQVPSGDMPRLLQALQDSLNGKFIVMYSRDAQIQNDLEGFGWSGKFNETDRNFFSLVTSNLGGTKTDLSLKKKIEINETITPAGEITDDVSITVTNPLPKIEGTKNESYIRVYVPEDSKLIASSGFDYKDQESTALSNAKADPDVLELEKNSVRDVVTGTLIGKEAGKTYFGNWLIVQGGESKTIHLTYSLPFTLSSLDRFSILFQKQPGSVGESVQYHVTFAGKKIEWKNFDPSAMETNSITQNFDLRKDVFMGMVLQDR